MTTATNYDDDEKPGLAGGLWTLPAKWNVIYTQANKQTNTHRIVCKNKHWTNLQAKHKKEVQ